MAITHARKALLFGITGLASVCLGALLSTAQAAPQTAVTADTATGMPSAVEDFSYPNADKVFEQRGITLKRGDGSITLVDCSDAWNIKVESRVDNSGYCFNAMAKTGYLTLELPDAYGVWAEEHPVKATLTAEGKETTVSVPANKYQPVGEAGDSGLESVLVELRVTG
ncbi:hypothetical protein OG279_37055 (plasmid) [Streptomyces sp. NBC_01201]|uniref:hypothetical protein n=1 Tax=Streptomyces sp. NBC_01201 TaxID=2903770 RepID=UPI002E0FDAC4|nr:hypothetical protein OG279_37055 [Streptomyces sp. NBC_01201]